MADIVGLPDDWRDAAAKQSGAAVDAFRRCADELELAWHQHAHDGEFYSGCRFCDWEREHNERYPG